LRNEIGITPAILQFCRHRNKQAPNDRESQIAGVTPGSVISLRPVHCIADVLRELKKESSAWAKENFDRRFTWQEGYAAFTVSLTATDSVRRYIGTQEAHHPKHSLVDELRKLLNAADIEFDEKYLL
jgi:hypothetical protein